MSRISICIPTWEFYGNGSFFLKKNLESIKKQTFNDFNIIVSDHSLDDNIEKLCNDYNSFMNIRYVRFTEHYGNSPANLNNSIKFADGEIIKILFQDDFFYDDNGLNLIYDSFYKNEIKWLVNGSNHTYNDGLTYVNPMFPKWNENLLYGVNTISSPSVLAFINRGDIFFDENLKMLMDCEMYYNLYSEFGYPFFLNEVIITNRIHQQQISNDPSINIDPEIKYIIKKYKME